MIQMAPQHQQIPKGNAATQTFTFLFSMKLVFS